MPVFSCLRTRAVAGVRATLAPTKNVFKQGTQVRNMAGDKMVVRPGTYQGQRVKDNFIYFTALGAIPLALITAYVNVFIGPAELREIPEDYVPEPHEYYKLPVERFFARIVESPEKVHERSLYYVERAEKMRQNKLLYKKYKELSQQRRDDKGWYFVPHPGSVENRSNYGSDSPANVV
ncbi:NADH dehydrogenase [ubiquinone] 1 beta subcomplex subunit 5 [Mactra antiquata]